MGVVAEPIPTFIAPRDISNREWRNTLAVTLENPISDGLFLAIAEQCEWRRVTRGADSEGSASFETDNSARNFLAVFDRETIGDAASKLA